MSGIRTIADLKDRCLVDDITGCWVVGKSQTARRGLARVWLPALARSLTPGAAIAFLTTGSLPMRGVAWHRTCQTLGCANPAHRTKGTRKSQMDAAKVKRSPLQRARIAKAKRAASKNVSEGIAALIRASTEPTAVLARRYDLSEGQVRRIRRQEQWKPVGVSAFSSWSPP